MASSIQILRSNTAKERPFPGNLLDGQPALNTNSEEPGLFFKASDGSIVKIGPAAITSNGNPPNMGGVGQLGNTIGELWLDKSVNPPILKVYDGAQWVDAGSGSGGSGSIDSSNVNFFQTGIGSQSRTVQSKLRDVVSVKDFGAVGDGVTDDTAAIQTALNSGAGLVEGPDGMYRITNTLTVSTPSQRVSLTPNCTILIDTTSSGLSVFNVQAANAVIFGGRLTTNNRGLQYLVRLLGENTKVKGAEIFFPTKSTLGPINNGNIPYNRGGVFLGGIGSAVLDCDIYNQEGQGIVVSRTLCTVQGNKIHDNILGIWCVSSSTGVPVSQCKIIGNDIYDNNVNSASGACGILINNFDFSCVIANNIISNNGEHGLYIRAHFTTITNNIVHSNFRCGIKTRDQKNSIITGNVCYGNSVGGPSGCAEILYQASDLAGENITITNNTCTVLTGADHSLRTAHTTPAGSIKNINVSNNVCVGDVAIAAEEDAIVDQNIVTGVLSVGTAFPTAPQNQVRFLVRNNRCTELDLGRISNSVVSGNYCANLRSQASFAFFNNRITLNTMTAQTSQLMRSRFSEFSFNYVEASGVTGQFLLQTNSAGNSNKHIIGNRFVGNTTRIIDDSTPSVSGSHNVIMGNIVESVTAGLVSMWGSAHTIIGNANPNGGGVGFVGMNNSWLVANSPSVSLRSGTSGNVVV
jgi:parallel beta-helix repeat protein